MSYGQILDCLNIQENLNAAWEDPREWGGIARAYPFTEYLSSPENRRLIVERVAPTGTGKLYTVTVKGWQDLCPDVVLENQPNPNCSPEGSLNQFWQDYTLDPEQNLQVGMNFGVTDFIRACEGNGEIFMEHLRRMVDVLDKKVSMTVAAQSVLLAGGWNAQLTDVQADVLQVEMNTPRNLDDELLQIRNAADESGYPSAAGIFGGREARALFQKLVAGCCASTGIDMYRMMELYGYAFAYDQHLVSALGSDANAMILAPGALQVLNISLAPNRDAFSGEYAGMVKNASNYDWRTINSPRFGLKYDLSVTDNCGQIGMALTFTGKVVSLPEGYLCPTDDLNGVNYAGKIKFVAAGNGGE